MQSISEIRALLEERGLRPKKRFGQNFLHDKNQLAKLVAAAAVAPGELILEVGPGTGTLTEALLDLGAEVVACEIDRDLAQIITDRLGDRVRLLREDVLGRSRRLAPALVETLAGRDFKLVANLPYGVASPLMVTLLLDHPECRGQHVTVQREVADRLMAGPGAKAYGPLGIIVQSLAQVRRVATVKAASFWPNPQVTSAMISIEPRPDVAIADPAGFARFIHALFGQRRKQLGTIFGRDRDWPAGITADRRPDALTVEQLRALAASVPAADPDER